MVNRTELDRFTDEINVQHDYSVQLEAWGVNKDDLFGLVLDNVSPEAAKITLGEIEGEDLVVSLISLVFTGFELGYRCALHNEMERMKATD